MTAKAEDDDLPIFEGGNVPPPKDVEDVGYKKPPKHSQFKKGQSGNPSGKPKKHKKAKSLDQQFMDFMNSPMTVWIDGKKTKKTPAELYNKILLKFAQAGNPKALEILNKKIDALANKQASDPRSLEHFEWSDESERIQQRLEELAERLPGDQSTDPSATDKKE